MKGYKVFNNDWTCRGKQYSCPGVFEENVSLGVCHHGMHFCRRAVDCFNYYSFNSNNHVAEVIAYGDVEEDDDKCCTDKLKIVKELSWHEVLELVNTGENCTGRGNSGDYNSGNHNSGNLNSGNLNSGDWNSGDWNRTNYSSGCFNTIKPKITFFNKESGWTYDDWRESDAKYLLDEIPKEKLEWILFEDMTEEEKEENPNAENVNGYLKVMEPKISVQEWWEGLCSTDKNIILSIPNFDAEIFKEITGIDVGGKND